MWYWCACAIDIWLSDYHNWYSSENQQFLIIPTLIFYGIKTHNNEPKVIQFWSKNIILEYEINTI